MTSRLVSCLIFAMALGSAPRAWAQSEADEKLSQQCDIVYAQLCKGIKPGPEMVGACNRAKPDIGEKIPDKCTPDFQNKVEGYEDFMREGGK